MNSLTFTPGPDGGPNVDVRTCNLQDNQQWILNYTDQTGRNKRNGFCLTAQQELEIWAGPLSNNSKAVVLFNRGDYGEEPIFLTWAEIGLPMNQSAIVRDLWAQKDLGKYTGYLRSRNITAHSSIMFKITPIE